MAVISFVVPGGRSQADAVFGKYRNSQCTSNSFTALCFATSFSVGLWSETTMNEILREGHKLHVRCFPDRKYKEFNYLAFEDIEKDLNSVTVFGEKFTCVSVLDECCISMLQGQMPYALDSAVEMFFSTYSHGIFTIGDISLALFRDETGYCIYDPHSCNPRTGLSAHKGVSVVIVCPDIRSVKCMLKKKFEKNRSRFLISAVLFERDLDEGPNHTDVQCYDVPMVLSEAVLDTTSPSSTETVIVPMVSCDVLINEGYNTIGIELAKSNIEGGGSCETYVPVSFEMLINEGTGSIRCTGAMEEPLMSTDSDVTMLSCEKIIDVQREFNVEMEKDYEMSILNNEHLESSGDIVGDMGIILMNNEHCESYEHGMMEEDTNEYFKTSLNGSVEIEKESVAFIEVKKKKARQVKMSEKKRRQMIKESMKKIREDEEYSKREMSRNREDKKKKREDEEYSKRENSRNIENMKKKREDEEYCRKEKSRNREDKKKKREDEDYREKEKSKDTESKKKKREDPEYLEEERKRHAEKMQEKRNNFEYREQENTRRRSNICSERGNDILKFRHNFYNQLNNRKNTDDSQISKNKLKFIAARNENAEFVCCCCEGLFFKHSVSSLNLEAIREKLSYCEEEFLEFQFKICNVQSGYMCSTCKSNIMKGRVPKLATSNGLKFVEIPECLKDISPLESRLCSPYLPFMCIKPMKSFSLNGQLGLRGSVVNIPIDVNECLTVLPRMFDEMSTIQVQLKRHFQHKSYYMFETIRPAAVCDALRYLKDTPLYLKHEISIDENYLESYSGTQAVIDFVLQDSDLEAGESRNNIAEPTEEEIESDEDTGEQVMLLDRNTVAQDQENIHIIAPGQDKNPVAPQFIENYDELCFPKIFCGYGFNLSKNITYNDRAKSECRRVDRRSCNPERLLFMAKQKIERQITSSINVCLRKTKKGSCSMKASDLVNQDFVTGLITYDSGYSFTKQIRNSPAFLEIKKKELLATIRTLGKPTFFLTLSAAETRWPELLACLSHMNSGEKISIKDALEMSNFDRTTLIRNDPVTCARYFDHKVSNFIKLIRSPNSIFKHYHVEDSYQRVEFQLRGSPHEHMFLWLKDAPKFDVDEPDSLGKVVEFIDEFITCKFDDNNPYIDLQKHKHTHTCYKSDAQKRQHKCRFNIPIACMPDTRILLPLPEEDKTEKMKENFKKIEGLMKHYYIKLEDRSFEYVLGKLEMNEDEYILAIRSSLKQVRVFLRRGTQEVGINAYNKDILCLFEANMDIQFVLEEYGLASYIVNYISKCEAGLSKLLRNVSKDIESGNVSLKEKFRKIGNVFLNGSLMSAQEAVYYLLCMPVSKNSRRVIFINTGPQAERVRMLKSKTKLSALPGDSNDVFENNIIEKYCKRKKSLENICLAEYAACYHRVYKDIDDRNDDEETDVEELKLRKKHAILRFIRYKLAKDPENYYRERLLLCLPFRNELTEIEGLENYEEVYQAKFDIVSRNEDQFGLKSVVDERLENALVEVVNEEQEEQDDVREYEVDPMYQVDVFDQGGIGRGSKENTKTRYTIPKRVSPQALQEMLSKLNLKQGKFVNYVLDRFQTDELPVRIFLSGSAGVGKSTVINAIYQAVTNYFDELPGGNNDKIVVLLTAYSGKASYLIGGVTLHTALALPVSQFGGRMPELSADIANTIRENLSHTKLLIIDEISFIGSTFFSRIDCRLRQIFGKNETFGGLSVLVVGDLFQLPPLFDRPIFQFSMNEFGNLVDRNPLWNEFSFYELTEVMRQREDLEFVGILNNIAIGQVNENDVRIINTRSVSANNVPREAIRLFNTNAAVDKYNKETLDGHVGLEYRYTAKDFVVGNANDFQKRRVLNCVKSMPHRDTNGLWNEIRLKIGIKYMLTSNVDVSDGLCNGGTGILKNIVFKPGTTEPLRLFLKFDKPEVGKKKRQEQENYMLRENINKELTPIDRISCVLNYSNKLEFQVVREQFPVTCAEAITIHKSQGQTYDQVVIDFNNCPGLTRQMLYVALSRVTRLSGLFLIGKFPDKKEKGKGGRARSKNANTEVVDPVMMEMERLRQEKQLDL